MYHGAHTAYVPHVGICLAYEIGTAGHYAGRAGYVAAVTVDTAGLTVREVGSYDRGADAAPGDDGDTMGADVLVYTDEDPHGHAHQTMRIMTPRALAAMTTHWVVDCSTDSE